MKTRSENSQCSAPGNSGLAAQLKNVEAEFRKEATRILEMLANELTAPIHTASRHVRVATEAGGLRFNEGKI